MLLKTIKYYNFRPFKGEQSINLETNSRAGKNVVVILGDNTFGKSTFVLSFIWCLYGKSLFSKASSILNAKVEDAMQTGDKEIASVELEFEEDNRTYILNRTQEFYMGENGRLQSNNSVASLVYKDKNGETKSVGNNQTDIEETVKLILPQDLSSFFFFEGEKNNEIKKKDLRAAVERLIGLGAIQNMREHLFGKNQNTVSSDSIMGDYLEKQNDESGELAKAEYEKKLKAEEELRLVNREIEDAKEQISKYEREIENIAELLKKAAPTIELKKALEENNRNQKRCTTDIAERSKRFLKLMSAPAFSLFVTPLLSELQKQLKHLEVDDKGIKGIDASGIRELLQRGECLCGTDLKEGSLAYKNVEKYMDYVPPRSIGVIVRDLEEKIAESQEECESFVETFTDTYEKILELRQEIFRLESDQNHLISQLKEMGSIDTQKEEELPKLKNRREEQIEKLEQGQAQKGRLESTIQTAIANFNKFKGQGDRAKKYQLYYRYAEEIYHWAQRGLEEKGKKIKEKLEETLQLLFARMYSGEREISIDERYNIVLTYKGKPVDDTGGLRIIQYFSYVAAIVKVAYDLMNEKKKEDITARFGEQYPLVLDAAFSHADVNHTKNIARELADSVPQLIFAVMHKDWKHASEGLLGRVSHIYELDKIDETEVKIRSIGGR